MLIDWFTVGAQALNFIILIWLMKRFLYKPILNAIDAREQKIAAELADADAKKSEAKSEREEFRKKNEDFDRQRADMLGKVTGEANAAGQKIMEDARKAAEERKTKREETLQADAKSLNQDIRRRLQDEVFSVSKQALADLSDSDLDSRMIGVFIRRIQAMEGPAKSEFGSALMSAGDPASVRSAMELPETQRAAIQNALNETFSGRIRLQFETRPELISGIEIVSKGLKVGWNIDAYLETLERNVAELLDRKA
ncbi:MAG: F0F1 ATP synthase subunit delta [Fibrobacteria bacterium]